MKKTAVSKTLALFLVGRAAFCGSAAKRGGEQESVGDMPEAAIKPWEDMWRKK